MPLSQKPWYIIQRRRRRNLKSKLPKSIILFEAYAVNKKQLSKLYFWSSLIKKGRSLQGFLVRTKYEEEQADQPFILFSPIFEACVNSTSSETSKKKRKKAKKYLPIHLLKKVVQIWRTNSKRVNPTAAVAVASGKNGLGSHRTTTTTTATVGGGRRREKKKKTWLQKIYLNSVSLSQVTDFFFLPFLFLLRSKLLSVFSCIYTQWISFWWMKQWKKPRHTAL